MNPLCTNGTKAFYRVATRDPDHSLVQRDFIVDHVWDALDAAVLALRGVDQDVRKPTPEVKEILQALGYRHPKWDKPEPKRCATCGHEL